MGGDEKYIQNFSEKNLKEKDHSGDLGIDRRIIFLDFWSKFIFF
jgi:hypothetical protein